MLEIKDRTTISSGTTLPQDEPDYDAALTFMLSEATRLIQPRKANSAGRSKSWKNISA